MRTQEYKEKKKKEIMEKCFECYCDNGLRNTGIKELGKYCGMTSANLYSYFNNVDELIIQSTAYCMTKVEDDFMELSPKNPQDIMRFISEIPKWSAQKHGKRNREKLSTLFAALLSRGIFEEIAKITVCRKFCSKRRIVHILNNRV